MSMTTLRQLIKWTDEWPCSPARAFIGLRSGNVDKAWDACVRVEWIQWMALKCPATHRVAAFSAVVAFVIESLEMYTWKDSKASAHNKIFAKELLNVIRQTLAGKRRKIAQFKRRASALVGVQSLGACYILKDLRDDLIYLCNIEFTDASGKDVGRSYNSTAVEVLYSAVYAVREAGVTTRVPGDPRRVEYVAHSISAYSTEYVMWCEAFRLKKCVGRIYKHKPYKRYAVTV